jgi:hypothetical protein
MATFVSSRPRVKVSRFARVLLRPVGRSAGVVRLTVGREVAGYLIRLLPSDFGDCFRLSKVGVCGDVSEYDVCLDNTGQTCECMGFLRHGHCKHVAGLMALRNAGKL